MKLKFKILNKFIKFLIYIKFVGPVNGLYLVKLENSKIFIRDLIIKI